MGGSAFVLMSGLIVLYIGGAEYGPYGWFIIVIGAVALAVNFFMRKQFL